MEQAIHVQFTKVGGMFSSSEQSCLIGGQTLWEMRGRQESGNGN